MYEPYLTSDEYYMKGGKNIDGDNIKRFLISASRHIDTLTFNKIAAKGFENLTEFQQEIIKQVCFDMADFEYENEDLLNSVLQSYSVNGVSMQFGSSWNIAIINGVAVKQDTYNLLGQTGLCYRGLR